MGRRRSEQYDWARGVTICLYRKIPELEEIQRIIPLQCEIKAECKIYFLRYRHVLIRLANMGTMFM